MPTPHEGAPSGSWLVAVGQLTSLSPPKVPPSPPYTKTSMYRVSMCWPCRRSFASSASWRLRICTTAWPEGLPFAFVSRLQAPAPSAMHSATWCCEKNASTSCTVTLKGSPRSRTAATTAPSSPLAAALVSKPKPAGAPCANGWVAGCRCRWLLAAEPSPRPSRGFSPCPCSWDVVQSPPSPGPAPGGQAAKGSCSQGAVQ
mmetsp:Transcript_76226/g.202244  ORF Transcript_76226/g.202244 Transcript_76226/m.202244 type:complete len:201 (+) Transcript_76226:318-920(+)